MGKGVTGTILIVLGLLTAIGPLQFVEREPYGGMLSSDAVFYDVLEENFLDLAGFLKKFPSYADMDAEELARRLHAHFFSETPYETYRLAFLSVASADIQNSGGHGDPLGIRGDLAAITPTDVGASAIFAIDAINHGLVTIVHKRVAFRYAYALGLGVVLCVAGAVLLLLDRKKKSA